MPLRLVTLIYVSFCLSQAVSAKEAVIFDVKRQLSLKPGESKPRDFYINAGSEAGLKKNMLVVVNRRTTLYDSYKNSSPGDLYLPVAQMRIIHVQKGISVARVEKMVSRKFLPELDHDSVMIGDQLDMETIKMAPTKTAAIMDIPLNIEGQADFSSQSGVDSSESLLPLALPSL